MTILKRLGLIGGLSYQVVAIGDGSIANLPANYTQGRIVFTAAMKGYWPGLTSAEQDGISVWDFNESLNRYTLSSFKVTPSGYETHWFGGFGMASNTLFMSMDPATLTSLSDAKAFRAKITIGAAPNAGITYVQPYVYVGDENTNHPEFSSAGVGYNGALLYGYYNGGIKTTTNGWINKVTATGFQNMNGSVCSGLDPATLQSQPCLSLCMLGGTVPNGYLVVTANQNDYNTTCRFKLVNCTGQPVVGAGVTYAGEMTNTCVLPLTATTVCASDVTNSSCLGRISLLYVNSATAPTTLTKGAECGVPAPPSGIGFTASDVERSGTTWMNSSNYYSGNGKALVLVHWKLKSTSALANGDSSYYVYAPCKIQSTGNTNITATILTTDVDGKPTRFYTQTTVRPYGNYQIQVVSSPNGKSTVLSIEPGTAKLIQQTFQL